MIGFIPMNDVVTIYSADLENADKWGKPTYTKTYSGKCQLTYKTGLSGVYLTDGQVEGTDTTVLFKNMVRVRVGDRLEYTTIMGVKITEFITSVSHMRDWGGKVFATRVVSGAAKRDY